MLWHLSIKRTRGLEESHTPLVVVARRVNKSELSFDIWWLYLNGTTPHLATRIHEANPVRELKSQSADVKAIQVLKRGQSDSNSADKTILIYLRRHGGLAPDFPGFPSSSRRQRGPKVEEMAGQIRESNCRSGNRRRKTKTCSSATLQGVANGKIRDAEILVRNPSPRLFGKKFRDSKKVKTNHAKTRFQNLS